MSNDGLLLIRKPSGCTSHDVVQEARRALRQRKIGHCGTLDPDATGLLLLTLGRGTRLTRFLIRAPKVYEGAVRLGVATDTYDASGKIVRESPVEVSRDQLEAEMSRFVGVYDQISPPYSAKKVKGRKLYELAREGKSVPRQTTSVRVYEFSLTSALTEADQPTRDFDFRLSCSSGTYARSLAHELGERLECGGHLCELRRVQIGDFSLRNATDLEQLRGSHADPTTLGEAWIPFHQIPLPFPQIVTDAQQERRVLHGQTVLAPEISASEGDWVKVTNSRGHFIAVGMVAERIGDKGLGVIQPRIVFH